MDTVSDPKGPPTGKGVGTMNQLTHTLRDICRHHLLAEKWLIAPSLRVCYQWLETVTRQGQPCCNVRIKTLRVMALELTDTEAARHALGLLSDRGAVILIDRILARMSRAASGYLAGHHPSAGFAETIYGSLTDLQLAGLADQEIRPDLFEEPDKGRELAEVLRAFRDEARARGKIDYPEVLRLAIARLRQDPTALAADVLVLVPDDSETTALERLLLDALPAGRRCALPVDQPASPGTVPAGRLTDASLLRWVLSPAETPLPAGDGSAGIFRAVGEVNEVREVIRRCLAGRFSLDEVEILYSDAETYVPLIYELFVRLQDDGKFEEDLPVTFADGIPARYSRPGRALSLWLAWIQENFPQRILVQMIREGLLEIPRQEEPAWGFSRLAGLLRSLGIGFGQDRYLAQIDEQISALEQPGTDAPADPEDGEAEAEAVPGTARRQRLPGLRALRDLVKELLHLVPGPGAGPGAVLDGAKRFVTGRARAAGRLDLFARQKLYEEMHELEYWIGQEEEAVSLNVWEWLAALPRQARVQAGNPEPGAVHVASLLGGGHSGRRHTFLVGLDDGRFPGAGLQDPLLLDRERSKLSSALGTASQQLHDKLEGLARLLARLRGPVTLSFSCHNLHDDREMFPSPVILSAYHILLGKHTADLTDLLRDLPAPASFAPDSAERCLDEAEWWAWRQCGADPVRDPEALVAERFPHLGRGLAAARQRRGDEFTIFDGRVPQAGKDLDPLEPRGPVLTASRLETIGRCPLAYFFQYVLGIRAPEDLGTDPTRWLNPLALGSLLHETFEQFIRELQQADRLPEFDSDHPRLMEILKEAVQRYQKRYPVPGEAVFRRECRLLEQTARIFLREEEEWSSAQHSRPAYLEASIGGGGRGAGTPLDTAEPVPVALLDGTSIRVRGRVDRIDRLGGEAPPVFAIWDYKTGSARRYDKADPFQQGRFIQSALYLALVAERLKTAVSPEATLAYFGYFFPSAGSRGERLMWSPAEVKEGREVLQRLVRIAGSGAFLPTNDHDKDCRYCDHRSICGDVAASAAASQVKLDNGKNTFLQPFRELRTDGEKEEA